MRGGAELAAPTQRPWAPRAGGGPKGLQNRQRPQGLGPPTSG